MNNLDYDKINNYWYNFRKNREAIIYEYYIT